MPLRGKVSINKLPEISCSYASWVMKADINKGSFNSIEIFSLTDEERSEWVSISNDGIKITFITADHLKDLPLGTYSFTNDDQLNRVIIEKYIGPFMATNPQFKHPEEWDTYPYRGELIIEEQIRQPERATRESL